MAYPELVSGGGVSKSHKFKGLVKVGASKGVIRVDLKKSWPGGGFRATRKPPWIRHWVKCSSMDWILRYIKTYLTFDACVYVFSTRNLLKLSTCRDKCRKN